MQLVRCLPFVLFASCLDATAIDVQVYTDVSCSQNAQVDVVVGDSAGNLEDLLLQGVVASAKDGCTGTGQGSLVGDVVLVPSSSSDATIAFAVMTRLDGGSPDHCGDPSVPSAERATCIIARRIVQFVSHQTLTVPVALTAACAGVLCTTDQTCVNSVCTSAVVSADGGLGVSDDAGANDAGGGAMLQIRPPRDPQRACRDHRRFDRARSAPRRDAAWKGAL